MAVAAPLFPELELVMDVEPDGTSEKTDEERIKEFKSMAGALPDAQDISEKDMVNPIKVDRDFVRFRDRVACEKSQVLRYERAGVPLWIGSHKPNEVTDIPCCPNCGQPRIYEFQINPQLLSHLQVETVIERATIDWGVLAIYTCSARSV